MLDQRKGIPVKDRRIGPPRSFRLDDATWAKLCELARTDHRDVSSVIRIAVYEYLEREYDEVVKPAEYRYSPEQFDRETVEHCRIKHNGCFDPSCGYCDAHADDAKRLGIPRLDKRSTYDEPLKDGEVPFAAQWEVSD